MLHIRRFHAAAFLEDLRLNCGVLIGLAMVLLAALAALPAHAFVEITLLDAATATGAGASKVIDTLGGREVSSGSYRATVRSFQASGTTSSGAGSVTVRIEGSGTETPTVDGDWVSLGTITLTLGTTKTADGFTSVAAWRRIRGYVTAISGTGAAVTVTMAVR